MKIAAIVAIANMLSCLKINVLPIAILPEKCNNVHIPIPKCIGQQRQTNEKNSLKVLYPCSQFQRGDEKSIPQ